MGEAREVDREIEELLERQRRFATRRALLAAVLSLCALGGGAAAFAYGAYLNAAQADSDVHFYFPDYLQLVGAGVVLVATLTTIVSLVLAVRSRSRRGL